MNINFKLLKTLPFSDLLAAHTWLNQLDEYGQITRDMFGPQILLIQAEMNSRLNDLFPKKLTHQWQFKTKTHPAWQNCTDEMYEQIKHLARYDFQQIEI